MSEDRQKQIEAMFADARYIEDWRAAQVPELPKEALIARFPDLRSSKVFWRLLKRDASEMDVAATAAKYRRVRQAIEELRHRKPLPGGIIDDIEATSEVRCAVAEIRLNDEDQRLVIVEGPTGSGKTTALRSVRELYDSTHIVEANETWRSLSAALGDIARAVGCEMTGMAPSCEVRLNAIIDRIGGTKQPMILIDEAHHSVAGVLNLLKTLINRTNARFVVAGIDTLWRKLQANASLEAAQLVLNRMHCRVILGPPTVEDARLFFTSRLGFEPSEATLSAICAEAKTQGAMAFLRRSAKALIDDAPEGARIDDSALRAAASRAIRNIKGRKTGGKGADDK